MESYEKLKKLMEFLKLIQWRKNIDFSLNIEDMEEYSEEECEDYINDLLLEIEDFIELLNEVIKIIE